MTLSRRLTALEGTLAAATLGAPCPACGLARARTAVLFEDAPRPAGADYPACADTRQTIRVRFVAPEAA